MFTREEFEIERSVYYRGWGYDGHGSPGPKLSYERYQQEQRGELLKNEYAAQTSRATQKDAPFGAKRKHQKGHGWRENHKN